MALGQASGQTARVASPRRLVVPGPWVVAASVVLLRLLLVTRPPTPDEGGFLVVASQWHVGGTSLYGDYWVDRPPLLIGIFRIADLAGGLVALRVIGALAAAAAVLLLASSARRVFGERAVLPTAVVAGALLVSPLLGAGYVDGELLAVPFVALGIRLAVEALCAEDPLSARGAALATGVAAVLAVLVKQNFADVVVFAAVCWLLGWQTRRLSGRTLRDLVALAGVGVAVGYAVVMLWAMAHGTSPLGVYQATYPFRVHAGRLLVAGASAETGLRLNRLILSVLLSGAVLVVVAFAALALRRSREKAVVWALVVTGLYAAVSIAAGGSYWLHYLIEVVPVVALASGAIAAAAPRVTTALAALVAASALVAQGVTVAHPAPDPGAVVGRALSASAQPGDTVLSAFGDADILQTTGMSSPYPYLWSLPSRTLDPDLTLLRGVLAGSDGPTWIVVRGRHTLGRLHRSGVAALVENRYRPVAQVCSRTVYLMRGLDRPALRPQGRCSGVVLP
jgi:4-amino-4-deoxy-L-arabinose transferase-like glycosyltransferase